MGTRVEQLHIKLAQIDVKEYWRRDPRSGKMVRVRKSHRFLLMKNLIQKALAGGFTHNIVTDRDPTEGFALSPYPERSAVFDPKTFSRADLGAYVTKNADLLTKPGHNLGAWREKASDGSVDKIWLDVSIVSTDLAEAETTARKFDQIALWNIGKSEEIHVGGTGGVI